MQFQELSEIFDKYKSDKDIFHDLMQTKAREILLVSTLYDAFILEQEGQLSEQIFGEYYQLNLSSAPGSQAFPRRKRRCASFPTGTSTW